MDIGGSVGNSGVYGMWVGWDSMGEYGDKIVKLKLDYEVENDLLYPKFGYKNTPKNVIYPGVLIHSYTYLI